MTTNDSQRKKNSVCIDSDFSLWSRHAALVSIRGNNELTPLNNHILNTNRQLILTWTYKQGCLVVKPYVLNTFHIAVILILVPTEHSLNLWSKSARKIEFSGYTNHFQTAERILFAMYHVSLFFHWTKWWYVCQWCISYIPSVIAVTSVATDYRDSFIT